jgi:hypothetical protein
MKYNLKRLRSKLKRQYRDHRHKIHRIASPSIIAIKVILKKIPISDLLIVMKFRHLTIIRNNTVVLSLMIKLFSKSQMLMICLKKKEIKNSKLCWQKYIQK